MRVGIFVLTFPTPSETFIVTKCLGLIDAGVDVRIFTLSSSNFWERFDTLKDRRDVRPHIRQAPPTNPAWRALLAAPIHLAQAFARSPLGLLRLAQHSYRHRQSNGLGFLRGLYLRLPFVGEQLDVLHVEFDYQGMGWADLKEYLGCKLVLSARGAIRSTNVVRRHPNAPEYLFSRVDRYHMISHYLHRDVVELGLAPATPVTLIEPAIDLSLFTPPNSRDRRPNEPIRIISVGRISWTKGYEFALDAIALVRDAGVSVRYTIYGEGEYREAIVFAASQHGLLDDGTVELAGAVSREGMAERYENADIMLHSALGEGFCNAVIEAQAMQLPVVTSDAGGLPENVEDGVTGFVVPRRDAAAMAECVIQLACDPELRVRMGRAGRQRVLDRFDLAKQTPKFVELYRELVEEKPGNSVLAASGKP